jgi:hypothetical protein
MAASVIARRGNVAALRSRRGDAGLRLSASTS